MSAPKESKSVAKLRSLKSVRERCSLLLEHPECLCHFDVDLGALDAVTNAVLMLVLRDYETPADIPPHSRWRHMETPGGAGGASTRKVDRLGPLICAWDAAGAADGSGRLETVRRLLDLFVVSVLLDAGAGSRWTYKPKLSQERSEGVGRSEGLALAALDWFLAGGLSSDGGDPHRADADGLAAVTADALAGAFQVSESNPLVGVEGRAALLQRLGAACKTHAEFFGPHGAQTHARPGNMLDYLLAHPTTTSESGASEADGSKRVFVVRMDVLWDVVVRGLSCVWPATRTTLDGEALGDVWPCAALAQIFASASADPKVADAQLGGEADRHGLVPFHKLSQWLAYSLAEPLALAGVRIAGADDMTGLAEYRNGGLFVDMGVLRLRTPSAGVPRLRADDDAVAEWRALTVALLDRCADAVRRRLGMDAAALPLAKVLEAGTWKAGREVAARMRPETMGPPIEVVSDGTLF